MSIQRTTAKRQVSAARNLLVILETRALRPASGATDIDQIRDALDRLNTTTEELARETYQPSRDDVHAQAI